MQNYIGNSFLSSVYIFPVLRGKQVGRSSSSLEEVRVTCSSTDEAELQQENEGASLEGNLSVNLNVSSTRVEGAGHFTRGGEHHQWGFLSKLLHFLTLSRSSDPSTKDGLWKTKAHPQEELFPAGAQQPQDQQLQCRDQK